MAAGRPAAATRERLGLAPDELATLQADLEAISRPRVAEPAGFARALRAARDAGLIAEVAGPGGETLHVVHRWTARALGQLEPQPVARAHHKAGARPPALARRGRPAERERRCRAAARGPPPPPWPASTPPRSSCRTTRSPLKADAGSTAARPSCAGRRSAGWATGSARAGYVHQLGMLAELRGDDVTANPSATPNCLKIATSAGKPAALASGYHQRTLAELRGEIHAAEQHYTQALDISQRLEDEVAWRAGYHQLGIPSPSCAATTSPCLRPQRYTQALDINQAARRPAASPAATINSAPPAAARRLRPRRHCQRPLDIKDGSATKTASPPLPPTRHPRPAPRRLRPRRATRTTTARHQPELETTTASPPATASSASSPSCAATTTKQ